MNDRTSYIYLDADSSHWNFRRRTPSNVLRILDFDSCLGEAGRMPLPAKL